MDKGNVQGQGKEELEQRTGEERGLQQILTENKQRKAAA